MPSPSLAERGRANLQIRLETVDLARRIARAEERTMTSVLARILTSYAEAHHPELLKPATRKKTVRKTAVA